MKLKLDKINMKNIIIIYILVHPIIDVITSLLVRNVNEILTLGIVVRTLFMLGVATYSLIVSEKKYRIKSFIYYALLLAYMLAFLGIKFSKHGTEGILTQIKGIVKTFYLPIILVALIPIFKKDNIKVDNKILIYSLLGYTAVIFLARICGVGYRTYPDKEGTFGLFFAANEIGAILASVSPILVLSLLNGEKGKVINFITLFLYIFAILEMGTKAPFFGALILAVISFIICVIRFFVADKKTYLKKGIVIICITLISIMALPYSPVGKNIEKTNGVTLPKISFSFNKNNNNSNEEKHEEEHKEEEEPDKKLDSLISGRDDYLRDNMERYKASNILNKIFGIGYVVYDYENPIDLKLIEMDYFDIAICDGVLGFILYFIPFVIIAVCILKYIVLNIKKVIINQDVLLMFYSLVICVAVALLAGHVLNAPASGIFIAIITIELFMKLKEINEDRLNHKLSEENMK